ncbi:hypothetical protein LshimejAT787_1403040 [Lyophyllum shimeji]|uniref:Uncharacterized protein n=1 Tax=Lyophyllum shimeji TaxID=47721 RepID=A0A9P3PVN2_LYOSH|nr:hypothetical protein LshimejAT787_1403040 [Lyophyllum shimeji]
MAKATRSQATSKLDMALNPSALVPTLANAARLTPVPYLQNAAALALGIVDEIRGAKSNKTSFQQLAHDACALVYIILCRDQKKVADIETVKSTYLSHTQGLANTMHEIYRYTKSQSSRNKLIRMIQYKADTARIQGYRDRLKELLDVFTRSSRMSLQEALAAFNEEAIRRQQDRLQGERNKAAQEQEWNARKRSDLSASRNPFRQRNPFLDTPCSSTSSAPSSHPMSPFPLQFAPYGLDPSLSGHQSLPDLPSTAGLQYLKRDPQYIHPSSPSSPASHTSFLGDHNSYFNSVVNKNLGNTTSHAVTNSHNDSSVRRKHVWRERTMSEAPLLHSPSPDFYVPVFRMDTHSRDSEDSLRTGLFVQGTGAP